VTGEDRQDDDGRRWRRFVVPVDGDGAGLVLRDVYPYEQVVYIGSIDVGSLLAWAGHVQDPEEKAYLDEAARLMLEAFAPRGGAVPRRAGLGTLSQEQERVRRLLSSVPNPSVAYDRYLADLLELEDRIDAVNARVAEARTPQGRAGRLRGASGRAGVKASGAVEAPSLQVGQELNMAARAPSRRRVVIGERVEEVVPGPS
jgi:hypothetical protein